MKSVNFFKHQKGLAKRVLCTAVALCMCTSVLAGSISVNAASQADVNDLQDKIDAAEDKIEKLQQEKEEYVNDNAAYIKTLSSQIDAYEAKIDYLEKESEELRGNISDLQDRIDKVEKNIADTQAEIDEITKEIEAKQAEFDKSYDAYCERLRAMYISGSVTELEVLLTCDDISSMLTRAEMLQSVSEQDSETLQNLMDIMDEIEEDRQTLTKKKTQLDEDKEDLQSQKDDLDAQKKELESNLAEVKSESAEYEDALAEYNSKIASYDSGISSARQSKEEYEEEQARIEREIAQGEAEYGGGNYNTGSGTLAWPTYKHSISAGFPYYSNGSYHGGVDFPVPSGTAVHAADSGVVITAKTLNYSYGYYIIISHGNGMQTLYAHNSRLLVSVGQNVTKGQTIAYSGSTGNSTGPHCHFEVRINGKQVNPMNYLG